ncbi:MAG: Fur family transcriptional regulator [Planctomycetota bacterium]
MKEIAQRFERFLRERGLRLTRQRAEILRSIYATHKHLTADQLYALLRASPASARLRISRATVFRTLTLLDEGGFVQGIDLGREQGTLYEHTLGHEHHDHMICLSCHRIFEFSDAELEQAQSAAIARAGFQATTHRLNIFGNCARCASRAGGERPAARSGGKTRVRRAGHSGSLGGA